MEKQADLKQMLAAMADPLIRQWAAKRGLVVGDFHGKRNLMHVLDDAAYNKQLTDAMYGAAQKDRPAWEGLMRGMATLSGSEWTPAMQGHASNLSGDIATVAPHFMRWAPDVWDKLHGSKGSVAALTHAIAEANRGRPGADPRQAYQTAAAVFEQMYGDGDPMRHRGFSAAELGQLYSEGVKRGLVNVNGTPDEVAKGLQAIAGPISAVRDSLANQNAGDVTIPDMFNVYDTVASQYANKNVNLENQLRRGEYMRQTGAPSEYALAMQQRGGLEGSGSSLTELTALDDKLRQQAATSQIGNMVGATARLAATMPFKPGSPGAIMYQQLQAGQSPAITHTQWLQAMTRSGVDANTAARTLMDSELNQQYMTPELINAVRQNQFESDLQQHVPALPANATKAQRLQQQSQQDTLARSRGYRDWRQVEQLHGQGLSQVDTIMQTADQQADESEQMSPYGRAGVVPRTLDVIRSATPDTTFGDVMSRGVLNAIPTPAVPTTTSLGSAMAKAVPR